MTTILLHVALLFLCFALNTGQIVASFHVLPGHDLQVMAQGNSFLIRTLPCFRLELRKAARVNVHPAPYEDDEPSGYDYENDNDASEYCPNVALVSTLDPTLKL